MEKIIMFLYANKWIAIILGLFLLWLILKALVMIFICFSDKDKVHYIKGSIIEFFDFILAIYPQFRSKMARKRNMTTWEYPEGAGYVYRSKSGLKGPYAEFRNMTKLSYNESFYRLLIEELEEYNKKYDQFTEKALENGYRVVMNTPSGYKEVFRFDYDNRKKFGIASIGFDSGLFKAVDSRGYEVTVPKAPKGKYDYNFRLFDIQNQMARTAELAFRKKNEREYYLSKHLQLRKDLADLRQRVNPDVIRFRDAFDLNFEFEFNS